MPIVVTKSTPSISLCRWEWRRKSCEHNIISFDATLFNTEPQRHAELFAKDVPPSKVVRIIDRYLAYYIMTADKLQRTARWIENMEGGIEVGPSTSLRSVPITD